MATQATDLVVTDSPSGTFSVEKGRVNVADADTALHFVSCENVPVDEATDERIRKTIDWHIIPWMFGLYLLQYLDKTSLSYAAIMGIKSDLSLNDAQYAW